MREYSAYFWAVSQGSVSALNYHERPKSPCFPSKTGGMYADHFRARADFATFSITNCSLALFVTARLQTWQHGAEIAASAVLVFDKPAIQFGCQCTHGRVGIHRCRRLLA